MNLLSRFSLKHLICGNPQKTNPNPTPTPEKTKQRKIGYVINYREAWTLKHRQYISDLVININDSENYNRYKEHFRNIIKQVYIDLEDKSKNYIIIDDSVVISKSNFNNVVLIDCPY